MEKLTGDLLLGLKFVRLEILSTSFIDFLYEELGELRSRSLGLKGLNPCSPQPAMFYQVLLTRRVNADFGQSFFGHTHTAQ